MSGYVEEAAKRVFGVPAFKGENSGEAHVVDAGN